MVHSGDAIIDGIDGNDGNGGPSRSEYDWLLAAIPVPLLAGWTTAPVVGSSATLGLGVGAVVAATLVAYALFGVTPSAEGQHLDRDRRPGAPGGD
ncbi:hypothetical protein GCM10027435_06630 [Haloparvum alkalitolerans]|uniref:hypothetical protein n=1 Tax=Haloparvum alkalitolerans TaxID=1042953 RepID=UPI003CE90B98